MRRMKNLHPERTSSYMAHPIMFSATMTGPEIEKILPPPCSSSFVLAGAMVFGLCSEETGLGGTERTSVGDKGRLSGRGGRSPSSASGLGNESVWYETERWTMFRFAMSSKRDGRFLRSFGRPKPSMHTRQELGNENWWLLGGCVRQWEGKMVERAEVSLAPKLSWESLPSFFHSASQSVNPRRSGIFTL